MGAGPHIEKARESFKPVQEKAVAMQEQARPHIAKAREVAEPLVNQAWEALLPHLEKAQAAIKENVKSNMEKARIALASKPDDSSTPEIKKDAADADSAENDETKYDAYIKRSSK